jgi:hypothetical protein
MRQAITVMIINFNGFFSPFHFISFYTLICEVLLPNVTAAAALIILPSNKFIGSEEKFQRLRAQRLNFKE